MEQNLDLNDKYKRWRKIHILLIINLLDRNIFQKMFDYGYKD